VVAKAAIKENNKAAMANGTEPAGVDFFNSMRQDD